MSFFFCADDHYDEDRRNSASSSSDYKSGVAHYVSLTESEDSDVEPERKKRETASGEIVEVAPVVAWSDVIEVVEVSGLIRGRGALQERGEIAVHRRSRGSAARTSGPYHQSLGKAFYPSRGSSRGR